MAAIAACLREGPELRASLLRTRGDGSREYTLAGLLPEPWSLVGEHLEPGDVVLGRVAAIRDKERFALVEMLPGARGIVHVSEVDWTFARNVSDVLSVGQVVAVEVLELEACGDAASPDRSAGARRLCPAWAESGGRGGWKADSSRASRANSGSELREQAREGLRDATDNVIVLG